MRKNQNLAEKDRLGLENMKKLAESNSLTNKELLHLINKRMETLEDMVKSVDERERLIQKLYERLDQKLQDFIVSEQSREDIKKEIKNDWKWLIGAFIAIALFLIGYAWPKG